MVRRLVLRMGGGDVHRRRHAAAGAAQDTVDYRNHFRTCLATTEGREFLARRTHCVQDVRVRVEGALSCFGVCVL